MPSPAQVSQRPPPLTLKEKCPCLKLRIFDSGKPANIAEKMVGGKMDRFFAESCLLEQKFVKNPDISVQDLIKEMATKLGTGISIKRFARFQVGA